MKMVVRCSYVSLWFFALTFLLVQSYSDGARPSPAFSPVRSPTEELVVVDTGIIADIEALAAAAAATVAVGDRGLRRRRSVALVTQARRLLVVGEASAGDGTGTDGAGPSCRSNNMHITCSPPSPR
uniref:Uncharacterized protein n=1 Tax=Leersia perrieri TaxID=77586 RepID=A0A0D9VY77_9ORYZ